VALDANQLKDLLLTLNETDISEFTLKEGEFELSIRRGPQQVMVSAPVAAAPMLPIVQTAPIASTPEVTPLAPSTSAPPQDNKYTDITSPIVGTFYAAPAPDEANFVQIGDRIQKTQTVCIIEAMKIMNEIEAEVAGEIVEILVQNGQPVEFGQPLMRVKPA
jgi:acetyl-CoA carboxylase biotin carboxyl carrier protein